jgi:hypothetical protein
MNFIKSALILITALYLTGCASGAKMEAMIYQGDQKQYDEKLTKEMNVGSVSGGEETNPAWTSEISDEAFSGALKESLKKQGLFSESGKYKLEVKMLKVDQPMFGLDLTVTTHIQYILKDTQSNRTIMDETIVAEHTATFSDAFAAITRLRLANEGSGLKNIEGVLKKLTGLKIAPQNISLTK